MLNKIPKKRPIKKDADKSAAKLRENLLRRKAVKKAAVKNNDDEKK